MPVLLILFRFFPPRVCAMLACSFPPFAVGHRFFDYSFRERIDDSVRRPAQLVEFEEMIKRVGNDAFIVAGAPYERVERIRARPV